MQILLQTLNKYSVNPQRNHFVQFNVRKNTTRLFQSVVLREPEKLAAFGIRNPCICFIQDVGHTGRRFKLNLTLGQNVDASQCFRAAIDHQNE